MKTFESFGSIYISRHGFLKDFFGFDKEVLEIRDKEHLSYSDFLELQNLGLIQSNEHSIQFSFKNDQVFPIGTLAGMHSYKVKENLENWQFPSCYELTTAGKQILQHLNPKPSQSFQSWLGAYLEGKGLEGVLSE